MKKSKLLLASVVVSFALISAPSVAGPGKKKPPVVELEAAQAEPTFMDWFLGLFDF